MIRSVKNDPFDDDGPALREEQMRETVFDYDPFNDGSYVGQCFHGPVDDLHYDLIRHFDPTSGAWLSDEPLGCEAMNVYRYVSNRPAAASEPSQNMSLRESTV